MVTKCFLEPLIFPLIRNIMKYISIKIKSEPEVLKTKKIHMQHIIVYAEVLLFEQDFFWSSFYRT